MIETTRDTAYTATIDTSGDVDLDGSDYEIWATLTHDWGGEVVAETRATRTGVGTYEMAYTAQDMSSNGEHRIGWRYIKGGITIYKNDHIYNTTTYLDETTFFERHPYLSAHQEKFDEVERQVRRIIETQCGQKFEFYDDRYLTVDGSGNTTIAVPYPMISLETVTQRDEGETTVSTEDITGYCEISNDSNYFVRYKNRTGRFNMHSEFEITGNWGWHYVPQNIEEATSILCADFMNDDRAYFKHGLSDLYMDTHRMRFHDDFTFHSLGNTDVDILLMDYTRFTMSMV
jgi:hypothetical protein